VLAAAGWTRSVATTWPARRRGAKARAPTARACAGAPLEELILNGLRQRLMVPAMVEEFVAAYHEEVNRHRREETAARAAKERELAEVTRKLEGLIDALAEGYRTPGLQQRLDDLEGRKAALEQTRRPPCGCTRTSPRCIGARSSGCMRRWPIPGCARRRSASYAADRARGGPPGRATACRSRS
jgi:hypothetical protein